MSPESPISAHTFSRDIAPVDSKGQVVCYKHWERAQQFTSHTVANPGREFYVCGKPRDDLERCSFFVWADDISIRIAREARKQDNVTGMEAATSHRPSQAGRAQMARSPATPSSTHKRPRTPSPSARSASLVDISGTPKHRRTDGAIPSTGTRTRSNSPISTPASRAARNAAIEKALREVQRTASQQPLKSIDQALAAAASQEKQRTPSGNSPLPPRTNASSSRSSRKELIEAALQQAQSSRLSDAGIGSMATPPSPSPSSVSQNPTLVPKIAQPHSSGLGLSLSQATQSDAGYSITDEIQQVDMEDESEDDIEDADMAELELEVEDKAIQTDPVEDDEEGSDEYSVIDDFWSSPPPHSVIGFPVSSIPFTLPATGMEVDNDADLGSAVPDSAHLQGSERAPERVSWASPAPFPPQTPSSGRAGSLRPHAFGGNVSEADSGGHGTSMLLTPPGSSHFDRHSTQGNVSPSTSRRGPGSVDSPLLHERQYRGLDSSRSPSPSPTKGEGKSRDLPRSQWQMIQDDPRRDVQENPFHERAAALRTAAVHAGSPNSSFIEAAVEAERQSGSSDVLPGSLSADIVEQQVASFAALPEYIRRLERKERAAQRSAEIKAKKIADLEAEIQRLRNTNRALEETVAALQVRR
ncbi:hypothetical protein BD311DRAFT_774322 [Dichomitus squalens]|uniref:GRF-type domain-containing protein n=1 Tax=Dichomitus squalens TaxID=114155 RepID=A0A4Q9N0B3_9APHY|nr:hypothetical protein BD311DRAFT_774322 [Dichomitus squalens]